MLHILLADFAPLTAVIIFIIIAAATWQHYRKATVDQLHEAVNIARDLADIQRAHLEKIKAELESVKASLNTQEHRVLRVEIDLERKTKLLNAARNESSKMELLIGLMSKHIPDSIKAKTDELMRELSEDRRAFAEEQLLWEDAQTALLAHWGDDITKPVDQTTKRHFGVVIRRE